MEEQVKAFEPPIQVTLHGQLWADKILFLPPPSTLKGGFFVCLVLYTFYLV